MRGGTAVNGGPDLCAAGDVKCPDVLDLSRNTVLMFCDRQCQLYGNREAQLEAYTIHSNR